jgi:hypothetical protein
MITDAGYKRCSPSAFNLPHDPVIDDYYMLELQLFDPHKR